MARAKRQHFVPKFHLAGFTPQARELSESVWVYDKATDTIARRRLKDTAVVANYYTLPTGDGPVDDLERGLADVEALAATAVRRLAAAPEGLYALAEDERAALSGYVGLLHVRVPATRKGNEALAAFTRYLTLDMELAIWLGPDRRWRVELVQLDPPVAVRGPHHDDVASDAVEPDEAVDRPSSTVASPSSSRPSAAKNAIAALRSSTTRRTLSIRKSVISRV